MLCLGWTMIDLLTLDGFRAPFYKECWDIVKGDLLKVFEEFFENGFVVKSMSSTFITLVPKKDRFKKKRRDFRPISMVTSLNKIL